MTVGVFFSRSYISMFARDSTFENCDFDFQISIVDALAEIKTLEKCCHTSEGDFRFLYVTLWMFVAPIVTVERFPRRPSNYDNSNVWRTCIFITFCSAGLDTLNDNDYNITQLYDMLAQKGDTENGSQQRRMQLRCTPLRDEQVCGRRSQINSSN